MAHENTRPGFFINMYDKNGSAFEYGTYLHFCGTTIYLGEEVDALERLIDHLEKMVDEVMDRS